MASGRKQSSMGMGSLRAMNQSQPRLAEPETSIGKVLSGSISFSEPEPLDLKPITSQILPEVRQGAFIKDRYEGKINVFDELEKGNPLSEYGLKQMHHAFDLAEYSRTNPKSPAEKNLLNQSRKQLQDALAYNDFIRILREPDQDPLSSTFKYQGLDIPKRHGFDLMRKEQQTFHDKDRWLNFRELHEIKDDFRQSEKDSDLPPALQELKDDIDHPDGRPPIGYLADAGTRPLDESPALHQMIMDANTRRNEQGRRAEEWRKLQEELPLNEHPEEMQRIYNRSQEIIRESKNYDDERAVDYYKDTSNRSTGPKSLEPAKETSDSGVGNIFGHGFFGGGQDLKTDVESIHITEENDVLRDKLLGRGNENVALRKILDEVRRDGKPRLLVIPKVVLPTTGEQAYSIGKVKLEASGVVRKDKNGQLIFEGTFQQGNNAEVFTFPKGNRPWEKEVPTSLGRQLPITNYRTIIEGRKPFRIRF